MVALHILKLKTLYQAWAIQYLVLADFYISNRHRLYIAGKHSSEITHALIGDRACTQGRCRPPAPTHAARPHARPVCRMRRRASAACGVRPSVADGAYADGRSRTWRTRAYWHRRGATTAQGSRRWTRRGGRPPSCALAGGARDGAVPRARAPREQRRGPGLRGQHAHALAVLQAMLTALPGCVDAALAGVAVAVARRAGCTLASGALEHRESDAAGPGSACARLQLLHAQAYAMAVHAAHTLARGVPLSEFTAGTVSTRRSRAWRRAAQARARLRHSHARSCSCCTRKRTRWRCTLRTRSRAHCTHCPARQKRGVRSLDEVMSWKAVPSKDSAVRWCPEKTLTTHLSLFSTSVWPSNTSTGSSPPQLPARARALPQYGKWAVDAVHARWRCWGTPSTRRRHRSRRAAGGTQSARFRAVVARAGGGVGCRKRARVGRVRAGPGDGGAAAAAYGVKTHFWAVVARDIKNEPAHARRSVRRAVPDGGGAMHQKRARARSYERAQRGPGRPWRGSSGRRQREASKASLRTLGGACAGAAMAWGVESECAGRFRVAAAAQGVKNEACARSTERAQGGSAWRRHRVSKTGLWETVESGTVVTAYRGCGGSVQKVGVGCRGCRGMQAARAMRRGRRWRGDAQRVQGRWHADDGGWCRAGSGVAGGAQTPRAGVGVQTRAIVVIWLYVKGRCYLSATELGCCYPVLLGARVLQAIPDLLMSVTARSTNSPSSAGLSSSHAGPPHKTNWNAIAVGIVVGTLFVIGAAIAFRHRFRRTRALQSATSSPQPEQLLTSAMTAEGQTVVMIDQ
ncbi:hypothetical protein GGX14DRAFT_399749 [Mycena pura]|uniref:Uncharacterized protein n=1 Tax=Mycena pura TaxID=153505 RepID=A0AAD6VAS9_9AGAR|nr:hypothetical protein GGX14DRAFT_399749 [Mycena pura]